MSYGGVTEVLKNDTTGRDELVKTFDESQVATLKTEDGEELTFKKEDLIDKDAKDDSDPNAKTGMSTGMKAGIAIGVVVVLGAILAIVIHRSKKPKS